MCEPDPQWRLIPQGVFFLVRPLLASFLKLQVEVPEHTRQDRTHFEAGKPRPGDVREAPNAIDFTRTMRSTLTSSRDSLEGQEKKAAARPGRRCGIR